MEPKRDAWQMNLTYKETIERILDGTKKIEFRIGKEKWRDMQPGDLLDFIYSPQSEPSIVARVEIADILRYQSFEELLKDYDAMEYAGRERDELLRRLIKERPDDETGFYTREEIARNGTFGILMQNPIRIA